MKIAIEEPELTDVKFDEILDIFKRKKQENWALTILCSTHALFVKFNDNNNIHV